MCLDAFCKFIISFPVSLPQRHIQPHSQSSCVPLTSLCVWHDDHMQHFVFTDSPAPHSPSLPPPVVPEPSLRSIVPNSRSYQLGLLFFPIW